MSRLLFLSFLLNSTACLDVLKSTDEDEDDKRREGQREGDCYDGRDNDDDDDIDCDDSGCADKPACTDTAWEQPDTDTGEEVAETSLDAAVTWGDSSVTLALTVTDGLDGADYFWGIAETAESLYPWTGEDCYAGYDLSDGTNLSYCHPISATGGELFYGGTFDAIDEGVDTVFDTANGDFGSLTTHIVDDRGSAEGPCFTWGEDTSYYSGYAKTCTEM